MTKGIVKKYFQLLGKVPGYLILYSICVIMSDVISLVIPVISSRIIDLITVQEVDQTYQFVLFLSLFYLIQNLCAYGNNYFYANFFKNCYVDLHRRVIESIYQYDMREQNDLPKAKIINTSNLDLISICEMPSHMFHIFMECFKLGFIIFIFLRQNIVLGLLVTVIHFLYFKRLNQLNHKGAKYFKNQRTHADTLTGLLSQILNGLKEVKELNLLSSLNKKLETGRKKWQQQYYLRRKCVMEKEAITILIVQVGKIALYLFLIKEVFSSYLSIGAFLLLLSYYEKMTTSVKQIMDYSMNVLDEEVSFMRIESIIKPKKKISKVEGTSHLVPLEHPTLSFQKVAFAYHKKNILKNVTMDIPFGQITVLTGINGVGKTTIFHLIAREIEPKKGEIFLSGEKIETYELEHYLNQITIVTQDPFIFNMSIKENFSLVNKNQETQIEVCKRIGLHEMIQKLPDGYHTTLKEFATNLSGGQKQLLSLGRALMKKSKILLLDEFTNSLDQETTEKIISILEEIKKDYLILIISHDQRIIEIGDKVLLLERGIVKDVTK